jgi:hypothetical protein
MKKVYPIVEGTYRFLGGWHNVPKGLQDLIVGHGYQIEENGRDYIIRGAGKLIICTKHDFKYYFEPFVDYFAEPEVIYEEGDLSDEATSIITHEEEVNSLRIASSDMEIEQLSLF